MLSEAEKPSLIAATTPLAAGVTLRPTPIAKAKLATDLPPSGLPPLQLLESAPVALCACDRAGNLVFSNRRATEMWRWPTDASPRRPLATWFVVLAENGAVVPAAETPLAMALRDGRTAGDCNLTLRRDDGSSFNARVSMELLRDPAGDLHGAVVAVSDIEARSALERHEAFLLRLAERLAGLTDQAEIIRVSAAMVGEHLGVDRCGFVETERASRTIKVIPGWIRPGSGLSSVAGRHELQALGNAEWQRKLGAMRIAVPDVAADPRTAAFAEYYRERGVRAYAGAPFVREGEWVASLTVTTAVPRAWTDDELLVLDHVVGRVWPLVERARAQSTLELVTTNAPIVLAYMDRESRIVFANRAFAARWGLEPAAVVGRHVSEVLGVEASQLLQPYVDDVLSGRVVHFEAEVPYAKIGRRYIRASYAPDLDAEGGVRGYLSAVSDVTERRAMEEAIQVSERRYRELLLGLPVALYVCDAAGRVSLYNDAAAELWGRRPPLGTEMWGGAHAVYDADGRPMLRDEWPVARALRAGDALAATELIIERPDGERRNVVSHPQLLHDASGAVVGGLVVLFDITERKQAELALTRSEERFRALTQHAPVGIFQTDAHGACVFVNDCWCRMAAMNADDAQEHGWFRAIHPDDRARSELAWRKAIDHQAAFAVEHRLLRRDGRVIWAHASAVEFRDRNATLLGHIGIVVDVTEQKTAEFALRESETRFRLLANRAPVGIFMTNPQGDTVYVNPSWCNMCGMTPEQAQGSGWTNALHPDDRERIRAEWDAAVRSGVSSKAEYRFIRPDGAITWVHGHAVQMRDATGRLSGYVGTVADFTERKHAELAMRESEERFRMLADNIAQFAWICDADGRWVWVNRRFLDYAGITLEEMNRGGSALLHHADHYDRVREKFRQHIQSGDPWEDSFPLRGHDGAYRWFLSRAIPIHDATGRITRWFGTNTDITDLRNTQEMLRKAQNELLAHTDDLERRIEARTASLREAIAQMEEFSYSVAHDLRAPLRAMNGYAEALLEDYGRQLDDTGRDYLTRIQRSSQRMEKLTHDILTYSRLARSEIALDTIDLHAVLRDLSMQYAELQPGAADLIIDGSLHPVRGHELSLGQCLGNLLTNAAKFVAPGVRPKIRVYTTASDNTVRVWIEDNGIGIKPEHHRNLFQIFERVPTPTPYDGTGIGLAIVRKAVEKMGGRCGVESDGVSGSRFWVELHAGTA